MLVALRPTPALLDMFRSSMLGQFRAWIGEGRPTPAEVEAEVEATVSAMKQIAALVDGSR
jgi:hypothetical protein